MFDDKDGRSQAAMKGVEASQETPHRPLLLVLDYPGRRDEGAIEDLNLEDHGFDLDYLLQDQLPTEARGDRYAQQLLRSHVDRGPATAVLGYCLAAHIGRQVAAELAQEDSRPPVLVMFNASMVTPVTVLQACEAAAAQLDGAARDLPEVITSLADRTSFPVDEAEDIVAAMRHLLVRLATAALEDEDEGETDVAIVHQLVDRHVEWIAHLIAAATSEGREWQGRALHVVSRDHPDRPEWPDATDTDVVAVDVDGVGLTRSKDCARLVAEWLSSTTSNAATPADPARPDAALAQGHS